MSKRILVVEDQPDNRQIIRDMLAPTDYEITEAENGEEALAAIAKQRPDLILMDIQLPIMDGYEATRPALQCPLLALSGHHSRAQRCPLLGEKQTSRHVAFHGIIRAPSIRAYGQCVLSLIR
jgi:CheY-like chemotaxis protein